MKQVFKKYSQSACSPAEFDQLEQAFRKKGTSPELAGWLKEIWSESLLLSAEEKQTNPKLWSKIKFNIELEEGKLAERKLRIYQWASRIAAVLIIVLGIVTAFFSTQSPNNTIAENCQTVSTPFGAKTHIVLPDGSEVWINAGSSLSFPNRFGDKRMVRLKGEAFFQVKKAATHPFIVSTSYGDVKVTGTSFNIKAFDDDNAFETTLVEGSVSVKCAYHEKELILKPGQQAFLSEQNLSVKEVDTTYFTSWKEGKLIFVREPFSSFVRKLERWYNIHIEYEDSSLNDLWYTGTIEMETLSEMMEMIRRAAPVQCSYNSTTRIITISTK